ncbi:hypothetical protein [Phenylobacterium sp.]|uniref:hypothetical protein n=1 Tax=Phenylobacterium sp. TaxID=1871053 RepID=UPI002732758C|nr:hypothetical protein [Phenylobacterium sp.]MDP3660628.1 hypothetical protein [Phenylobacterium sp.]
MSANVRRQAVRRKDPKPSQMRVNWARIWVAAGGGTGSGLGGLKIEPPPKLEPKLASESDAGAFRRDAEEDAEEEEDGDEFDFDELPKLENDDSGEFLDAASALPASANAPMTAAIANDFDMSGSLKTLRPTLARTVRPDNRHHHSRFQNVLTISGDAAFCSETAANDQHQRPILRRNVVYET